MTLIVSNSTETLQLIPLNSVNQVITTGFPPAGAVFTVTDDQAGIYPVTDSVWNDGVGTLTFTSPTVTAQTTRTLAISMNDNPLTVNPPDFQVDIIPPYRGKFVLTNAKIAWDYSLDNATTTQMFDYSGNGNFATAIGLSGAYLTSTLLPNTIPDFITTTTSPVVSLGRVPLAREAWYSRDNVNGMPQLNSVSALSGTLAVGFPIKTVQSIFWVGGITDANFWNAFSRVTIWYASFKDESNNTHTLELCFDLAPTSTARFTFWLDGNESAFTPALVNPYFTLSNQIVSATTVLSRDNSQWHVDLYLNQQHIQQLSWNMGSSAGTDTTQYKLTGFSGLGSIRTHTDEGTDVGANFSVFEQVAYSDTKDISFIATNASAWGLS